MNGVGIGIGLVGSTTVIATVYMIGQGYEWWKIALVVLISACFVPYHKE